MFACVIGCASFPISPPRVPRWERKSRLAQSAVSCFILIWQLSCPAVLHAASLLKVSGTGRVFSQRSHISPFFTSSIAPAGTCVMEHVCLTECSCITSLWVWDVSPRSGALQIGSASPKHEYIWRCQKEHHIPGMLAQTS